MHTLVATTPTYIHTYLSAYRKKNERREMRVNKDDRSLFFLGKIGRRNMIKVKENKMVADKIGATSRFDNMLKIRHDCSLYWLNTIEFNDKISYLSMM